MLEIERGHDTSARRVAARRAAQDYASNLGGKSFQYSHSVVHKSDVMYSSRGILLRMRGLLYAWQPGACKDMLKKRNGDQSTAGNVEYERGARGQEKNGIMSESETRMHGR